MLTLSGLKTLIGRMLDRRFPRAWLAFRIWRKDRHFEPEYWQIPTFCDRHHIAVDIGSNEGEFAFFMARFAKTVVAFEPNADLVGRLRLRVPRNVQIYEVALSRAAGVTEFRYSPHNSGVATIEMNNTLSMIEDRQSILTRSVETRTLDSYALKGVSFIKIDVEGHEEAVIEGAVETLRRERPVLLVESEDRHNPGAPARLRSRLEALGYTEYVLRNGHLSKFDTPGDEPAPALYMRTADRHSAINHFYLPSDFAGGAPRNIRVET